MDPKISLIVTDDFRKNYLKKLPSVYKLLLRNIK